MRGTELALIAEKAQVESIGGEHEPLCKAYRLMVRLEVSAAREEATRQIHNIASQETLEMERPIVNYM